MGLFSEDKPIIEMYHAQRKPSELTHLSREWRAGWMRWLLGLSGLVQFAMGVLLLLPSAKDQAVSTTESLAGGAFCLLGLSFLVLAFLVSRSPVLLSRWSFWLGVVAFLLLLINPSRWHPVPFLINGLLAILLYRAHRSALAFVQLEKETTLGAR